MKTLLIVKKKLLSDVIFDTLPFRVYDHFLIVTEVFS